MKDATGELSMTAVAVVAIAAIGVVFTTIIWPNIRTNILRSTYCTQAFGCSADGASNGMKNCFYCKDSVGSGDTATCGETSTIQCPDR